MDFFDPKVAASEQSHGGGAAIYGCSEQGGCAGSELVGEPICVEALLMAQLK